MPSPPRRKRGSSELDVREKGERSTTPDQWYGGNSSSRYSEDDGHQHRQDRHSQRHEKRRASRQYEYEYERDHH